MLLREQKICCMQWWCSSSQSWQLRCSTNSLMCAKYLLWLWAAYFPSLLWHGHGVDAEWHHQPVREAVNDRGLFTAGWFGVREKYCSGWKFTIVYDQANRLRLQASDQTTEIIITVHVINMYNYRVRHSVHKPMYHCCLRHGIMSKTIRYQPYLCHLLTIMLCKIRMVLQP